MSQPEIWHTADLHVGAYRFLPDHLVRCKEMLDAVIAKVTESQNPNKILVIAGDVSDRKNITEEERNLFLDFITNLVQANVHVIVMNGNHDFYKESLTMLEPLKYLARLTVRLHVVLNKAQRVTIGDVGFGCVPCQQDLTTKQLEGLARSMRKEAPCKTFYMVVHEAVYGSTNFRGTWQAKSDKYLRIPELPFVSGWMLGDIHQRQSVTKNAWYSGAPLQVKADENPTTGILQWVGSTPKFHPISTRGFRTTTSLKEALKFAAENHYVRFKGTVPAGTELPTNVLANGEIAAIEIDLDTEADTETEEFKTTIDLITPLPAFLAKRGMQPHFQTMAIDIVSAIIQRRTSVQAEAVDA